MEADGMPIAARFCVQSIPTVLVFRDGQPIERLDGLISEADLRRAFDRVRSV